VGGRRGGAPSGAQPADAVGSVAGYRVLRRIGSGDRSDVYLGASTATGTDGQRDVIVLKIFRDGRTEGGGTEGAEPGDTGDAAIDREVRALDTIPDGGVGRLLDVATLPDGRVCVVLAEDRGGSLGLLLAGGRLLDPGEAVTILAPVLATLAHLYDLGWVHPGIRPGKIRFDGAGRPVVGGLGGLRDLPPPGKAREELLDEVRCAFADLLHGVLDRVAERGQPESAALVTAWRSGTYREALAGLERALFEWSAAAPVRLGAHQVAPGAAESMDIRRLDPWPGRLASLEAALDGRTGPLVRAWAVRLAGSIGGRLAGRRRGKSVMRGHRRRAAHSFDPEPHPGRERNVRSSTRRGTWRAADDPARRHRRRLTLTGAFLVVVLLVGAWNLLAPPAVSSGPGSGPSSVAPASPLPSVVGGGAPSGSAIPPAAGPTAADQDALQGDDPVAATVVLLRVRTQCLAAADEVCLAEIAQPDSPALAGDSALIRDGSGSGGRKDGEPAVVEGAAPTVVDRIGNLALVALAVVGQGTAPGNDKPASVLVVKGEAGWRLREFFGTG